MLEICGEFFISQQGNVRAHQSIFKNETPAFTSPDLCPPTSTDIIPLGHKTWGEIQQRV